MLTLDTIMKDTVWVAKMNGFRCQGTMDEIGHMGYSEDCREFDICAKQPEHLRDFYDDYFDYGSEYGFITVQDYYNSVYNRQGIGTAETFGTEVLDVYSFILGGKAEFTISNTKSGNAYKYKVTRCKHDKALYFVRVKEGGNWIYGGCIRIDEYGTPKYYKGKKGTIKECEPSIKGIMYALNKGHSPLPRPMILTHHGKCACCGKKLDDDESVRRGFGPVCWSRINKKSHSTVIGKVYAGA